MLSGCWPGATGRQTLRCSSEQGVGSWAGPCAPQAQGWPRPRSTARRACPRPPLCAGGHANGARHVNGARAPMQPRGAPQLVHLLVRAPQHGRGAGLPETPPHPYSMQSTGAALFANPGLVLQERDRRGAAAVGGAPKRPRPSDPSDVFVLDFDGVIVNSEPEVRSTAQRFERRAGRPA